MHSESTELRVQRVRESKVESAEIVSAESDSTVRDYRVESTKSARIQSREGRDCEYRVESAVYD